jgi:cation transport protein ChaC
MHLTAALSAARACARGAGEHDDPLPGAFWVFAYGSLIWNPGFAYADRRPARLHGYHRRFCIRSTRYRGTPETPGLVLGLDRGGSCHGIAFLVPAEHAAEALAYLDRREIPDPVYRRRLLPVRLACGSRTGALTYVARRDWPGYCRLPTHETATMIGRGQGAMGSNREYLLRTLDGLRAAGIADPALELLATRLPGA